jgi:hypothetical protein
MSNEPNKSRLMIERVVQGARERGAEVIVEQPSYDALIARADAAGKEHGLAAASWYFDGNTTRETYEHVLRGIEDGDPEVMDTLPCAPLSGEWADDPTPTTVLKELGVDEADAAADDYLRAYEDGFYEASTDEIVRVARYQLS